MRPPDRLPSRRDSRRPVRVLASIAASLALANAAFWWPGGARSPRAPRAMAAPVPEAVVLLPVPPTRQEAAPVLPPPPPPPPSDLPPVEVPDEVLLREVRPRLPATPPLDERPLALPAAPSAPQPPATAPNVPMAAPPGAPPRTASATRLVERPARSPRQTWLPLPVYPEAARREGVRARVRVRVLVAETGGVLEAEIIERFVLDRRDQPTAVSQLPQGMDEAALAAARAALFHPAMDGGERVRAYSIVTPLFDPPRD